ncbi:SDR family NAD(P)-dependent oxidoreductase [Jiangella rhizosphaerae]|uniref:SDR family NAD(P)-dependent oxidoreductase n=1 Tax=Jiangella rhizosphaerae TaxID=2293569 RepID=A0A418KWV5_9ACTN|nr:SDR family NAD(P)-dependent oxidoreductase [Jiangella rhizosphaerae]RIQ36964.1 SDR family NAD(P)-dependent oxidoreductase [Jiangella rhizosphaerae]
MTAPLLTGRALVTGGTSGIGLAFAKALAARGCDLVLVARDEDRLKRTADELHQRYGVDVEVLAADLADRAQVDAVTARLADHDSPVEVFVNNAGKGVHSRLVTDDTSEHEHAIDLMITAVVVLGAAAARSMRERGHGVIVNVSSVAGLITMGGYSAVKSFVRTYSESLSLELAGTGVQVTALLPGWVRTEFHERAGIRTGSIPSSLWLDADRVVADCLADVEKGRVRSVPSARFKVLAWLAEHAPRAAVRKVTARLVSGRR